MACKNGFHYSMHIFYEGVLQHPLTSYVMAADFSHVTKYTSGLECTTALQRDQSMDKIKGRLAARISIIVAPHLCNKISSLLLASRKTRRHLAFQKAISKSARMHASERVVGKSSDNFLGHTLLSLLCHMHQKETISQQLLQRVSTQREPRLPRG